MKKLFTLLALLTCFLGVKAEEVVDLEIDNFTSWVGGWQSDDAASRVSIQDGCIYFHSEEATANFYDVQFQAFGIPSGKQDYDAQYTITIKIKGTVAQNLHSSFSGSSLPGDIPVTTDWQTLTFEGCQNNPDAAYFANSFQLLIQCGDYVGDWWISYVKITHEQTQTKPIVWQEWLTNDGKPIVPGVATESKWMGDAETPWADPNVRFNDMEKNYLICAWSKERMVNPNDDGGWDPFPATIEEVDGSHVFVCHGKEAITEGDPAAWDNQFWIQSPKEWKAGEDVKIHFRYKASKNVTAQTQIHHQTPSDYLIWHAIGDVAFTTEWQEFDATMTFADDMAGGWSIAFNLNPNDKEAIDFYFDDLSWQSMVLDEGFFAAASNTTTGIEYDYDNAVEFVQDPTDDELITATVGTKGKQDTWVNEIMISTVRGNDRAFKANTIKPSGTITGDNPDNWQDYTAGSSAKIKLPAAGVWQIQIAPADNQILFMKLEGEENQEPVAIVTNTTAIVVNGLERDDLSDQTNQQTGEVTVRENEGGTGETWDNQFFFKANRALEKGEVTVLKFKYKASCEAKTTTQCHGETPGAYMHWAAIGDVNFTTEWQNFEQDFTVPSEADGMWCIAFNMAEIKEACDYEITDVQWFLKDDCNEEGKTPENLINETGTANFFVKEGAGTNPYQFGGEGIFTVTDNSTTNTDAIYNLSGQRVGADYKGIVIKNGKKVVVK